MDARWKIEKSAEYANRVMRKAGTDLRHYMPGTRLEILAEMGDIIEEVLAAHAAPESACAGGEREAGE
ncbi:hypothetical protein [Jiella pelagia]|uniref:Uncharacterized protein n=1 Tax=Jiella pelagia TaxID=2986949 RepID=A0ABY7C143_9HYPH|nr:hypothetical protein [Jiella pelagia]WAP69075.1 hypothetical protein OH818_01690 [Jiella pelagia]